MHVLNPTTPRKQAACSVASRSLSFDHSGLSFSRSEFNLHMALATLGFPKGKTDGICIQIQYIVYQEAQASGLLKD